MPGLRKRRPAGASWMANGETDEKNQRVARVGTANGHGAGCRRGSGCRGAGESRRRAGIEGGHEFATEFSGSLYALAIGGWLAIGAITPIGGLLLVIGWMLVAIAAVRALTVA